MYVLHRMMGMMAMQAIIVRRICIYLYIQLRIIHTHSIIKDKTRHRHDALEKEKQKKTKKKHFFLYFSIILFGTRMNRI